MRRMSEGKLMPTDDVLSLIAEVRQLCDGMPEGLYEATGTDIHYEQGYVPSCKDYMLVEEHEAAYFAALDPALVRALLDYVRSDLALRGVIDSFHGGSRARLTAAEDDFEAADVALRSLAAERMTT